MDNAAFYNAILSSIIFFYILQLTVKITLVKLFIVSESNIFSSYMKQAQKIKLSISFIY